MPGSAWGNKQQRKSCSHQHAGKPWTVKRTQYQKRGWKVYTDGKNELIVSVCVCLFEESRASASSFLLPFWVRILLWNFLEWWSYMSHLTFSYLGFLNFREENAILSGAHDPEVNQGTRDWPTLCAPHFIPPSSSRLSREWGLLPLFLFLLSTAVGALTVYHKASSFRRKSDAICLTASQIYFHERDYSYDFWIHEDFIDAAMSINVLDSSFISRLHRIRLHL